MFHLARVDLQADETFLSRLSDAPSGQTAHLVPDVRGSAREKLIETMSDESGVSSRRL